MDWLWKRSWLSPVARPNVMQRRRCSIGSDYRITVAGDNAYDTQGFVEQCRAKNVTPHVAQNLNRRGGSAIDQRTTRLPVMR